MPTAGATVWIAAIWFWSGLESGSCRIAMRMTFGAILLSISGHCVLAPSSDWQTPVTPEPGLSSAGTRPAPTGSATLTNTTGMPLPGASSAFAVSRSLASRTSGASSINSAAYWRTRRSSSPDQRTSIRRLRRSFQPLAFRASVSASR